MSLGLLLVAVCCALDVTGDPYLDYQLAKHGMGGVVPGGRLGLKLTNPLDGKETLIHFDPGSAADRGNQPGSLPEVNGFQCVAAYDGGDDGTAHYSLVCMRGSATPERTSLDCKPGNAAAKTSWQGAARGGIVAAIAAMQCY